jgi:hypothetical protein
MPIDPSIIGNVMAPQAVQMPDVNAMMRTQTQGMENIYQIEAAREAQAAEAAKAQEDAAVKALFPAYSYVLETGDLAGGLELAPPQYRDVLIPHMKALEGKPLEEIQAALTGSLVTSETGRALLENRSRAATLGVQEGQLTLAQKRLAAEQAAAGVPEPMSEYQAADIRLKQQAADAERAAKLEAPKIKMDASRAKVDDTLSEMLLSYNKLMKEGAIVSTEASGLENVIARTSAGLGTTAGRALGTKAQTERDYIQSLRMNLINDIKTATGKSSQELNSNFELQAALDALSDPYSQSFETALRTIAKISRDYGKGEITVPEIGAGPAPAGAGGGTRRYDSTGKRIQ